MLVLTVAVLLSAVVINPGNGSVFAAYGDLLTEPCDFSGYEVDTPISGNENFTLRENVGACAVVKQEDDGNKYLHVARTGSQNLLLTYDFSSLVGDNNYTLEYRLKPMTGSCNMAIGEDTNGLCIAHSSNSHKIQYVQHNTFYDGLTSLKENHWYTVRMVVNQSARTMDCYVDGVLLCSGIDQRTAGKRTDLFVVFVSGNSEFGMDDFKVYSGSISAQKVETVALDFSSFAANDAASLSDEKVSITMPSVDAESIVQYDRVSGAFGRSTTDQSFFLHNTEGVYEPSPDVRLNVGVNHLGRINAAGDREVLSFYCAFDEKMTPIIINSYAWSLKDGAVTAGKFGGSAAEGYTVKLEADNIQLMGNHTFTLPTACVPNKWYYVELAVTAGSADGTGSNRFSAYLDSIPVCEDVEMTDFRLRFDEEYEAATQFLGFSQIWLNHNFNRYCSDDGLSYEAGGIYFDDVKLTKYIGGEPMDAIPATVLEKPDDPDFSKYTAGLTSWTDGTQDIAAFRSGLAQSAQMTFRDASGSNVPDTDPASERYFDLVRSDGAHLYGRIFGGQRQVVAEDGLISYSQNWHQTGEWSSTKRSAVFEGRMGLGGRNADDESTVLQAPYTEGTPGNGIYDDYLDYSIQSDGAGYAVGEAYAPLHYETSVLLDGDIGMTVYLKVNGSGTYCQVAQFKDGVIYGSDTGRTIGAYQNGRWYKLSVSSYPGSNTVDLRLNGVPVAEAMEISETVQFVSTFRFGVSAGTAEEDGYAALDDIRIYAGYYLPEASVSVSSDDASVVVEPDKGYIVCDASAEGSTVSSLEQSLRLTEGSTARFYENDTFAALTDTVTNRSVLVVNLESVYVYYTIYTALPDSYLSEFQPVFSDGEGSPVTVMPLSGSVNAKLQIDNQYNLTQDAVFILAVYDENGALIGMDQAENTIAAQDTTVFETSISADSFARCYAKVFLWDSMQNLCPLAEYEGLAAYNDIWMPSVFGNNAVLQRDQPLAIWGKSAPYATIDVTLGSKAYQTTALADGSWSLNADPISVEQNPYTLSVESSAGGFKTFTNLLAGEVWLCSGQSNMEWALSRTDHAEEDVASANNSNIRLFTQTRNGTEEPAEDVLNGTWKVCSPDTVASFSGVAYLFGRELQQDLDVPIGLLYAAYGGARIECFISEEALAQSSLAHRLSYEASGDHNRDAVHLYNGMIAPLIPYTIRGAIWYQGCANATAELYDEYLEAQKIMIQDWRTRWGSDFPVLITQLAGYGVEGKSEYFPHVREAQWQLTKEMDNVEMAVILETGEENNIHPTDKRTVGHRLALIAKNTVYGMDVPYHYPDPEDLIVEGNNAIIEFAYTYDGFVCDGTPAAFEIRAADGQWYAATAEITGSNTVTVTDGVHVPVAVRCGFAGFPKPMVNLYNSAGLLVTPFQIGDLGD